MPNKIDQSQIECYLYAEMSAEEREKFEEKLFENDDLFYRAADHENTLVDRYASEKLSEEELIRFENSLSRFPQRRQKIANAIALHAVVKDQKVSGIDLPDARPAKFPLLQKIPKLFNAPSFAYVMTGFVVMLAAFSIFMLFGYQQKAVELERIKDGGQDSQTGREKDLSDQLVEANKKRDRLQKQVDNEREASGDIADELARERQVREKLQKDLNKLLNRTGSKPETTRTLTKESPPRVASIGLKPSRISRGNENLQATSVGTGTFRVAVNLSLPIETKMDERFSILLNDKPFLQNVAPRISADGKKALSLTILKGILRVGNNKLVVFDNNGTEITRYMFRVDDK